MRYSLIGKGILTTAKAALKSRPAADAEAMHMNALEQVTQQVLLGPAVRQNHALEHATIALLSSRYPESRLSGISFAQGFFIFGEIPTEAIRPTAEQALARLRGTEPELAIHERCGTNLAVTSMLTGFSAMTVARLRKPYNTFSNVLLASTAALVLSRPLGLLVQRFVTTRTPGKQMRIASVRQMTFLGSPAHFVTTKDPEAHFLASAQASA
jgi:hypothetical protein